MSDSKLRELERHWRESGSAADEGAHLRERVRAGTLEAWCLEVATYCGHETLGGPEEPALSFDEWVAHVPFPRKRGQPVGWARLPVAAARALVPVAGEPAIEDALAVADGAIASPAMRVDSALAAIRGFMLAVAARAALLPVHGGAVAKRIESLFPGSEGRLWLRRAIQDELIPWALGRRDPVRDRSKARG